MLWLVRCRTGLGCRQQRYYAFLSTSALPNNDHGKKKKKKKEGGVDVHDEEEEERRLGELKSRIQALKGLWTVPRRGYGGRGRKKWRHDNRLALAVLTLLPPPHPPSPPATPSSSSSPSPPPTLKQGKGAQSDCLKELTVCSVRGFGRDLGCVDFTRLISAAGRAGRPDLAMLALSEMKLSDVKADKVVYSAAIAACMKAGHVDVPVGGGRRGEEVSSWKVCLDLLEEMGSLGLRPNCITYNAAITACGRAGRWKEALGIWDEMQRRRLYPDEISYNAILTACARGSRPNIAMDILEDMVRASDDGYGVRPTRVTFNAAIDACARGRPPLWEAALELLQSMQNGVMMVSSEEVGEERAVEINASPDRITYNSVIKACERASEWEPALRLLGDMKNAAQGPYSYLSPDIISYNAAISACGRAGELGRALALLEELKRGGACQTLAPDTISYNTAISACAYSADILAWRTAIGLLDEMRSVSVDDEGVSPDRVSCYGVMAACRDSGRWEEALSVLRQMQAEAEAEANDHRAPCARGFTIAIAACERGGAYRQAEALLQEMQDRGVTDKLTPRGRQLNNDEC